MKILKKIGKYFLIILILLIIFRGVLYRNIVTYSTVGIREHIALTNNNLTQEIDLRIYEKTLSIEEIIKISNELTSKKLDFTFNQANNNPNKIFKSSKANCIGYSALFNSIGNYILLKQNMNEDFEFLHLIGKIKVLGFDIHSFFESSFFKDHDFNEIHNNHINEKIFVDPSLRDYFRIDRITSE